MSTWILVIVIVFHEMNGYNAINLYSNTILSDMFTENSAITPKTGSVLIGLGSVIGAFLAIYFLNLFKRRTLLVMGEILICICHILIGIFCIEGKDTPMLIMLVLVILVY